MLSRFTSLDTPGATDPGSVPRQAWPPWERYTFEEEPTLSVESLTLLDGLVSRRGSGAQGAGTAGPWGEVVRHPIKRYAYNNHPVLVSGKVRGP